MSIHIGAKPGQIAPTILLPGDPLRARYIAKNMLEDANLLMAVHDLGRRVYVPAGADSAGN